MIRTLFSFQGRLDRRTYLLLALPVWLLQHAFAYVCLQLFAPRIPYLMDYAPFADLRFAFNPLRSLLGIPSELVFFLALLVMLTVGWALAALTCKRASMTKLGGGVAALAIIPMLQPVLIAVLAVLPESPPSPDPDGSREKSSTVMRQAILGVLAGMLLCVALTAFATLVLHAYGYLLFLAMPLFVGMAAGYVANRDGGLPDHATGATAMIAILLGGAVLLGVAIEGLICLLMAAPLAIPLCLLGSAIGEKIADRRSQATLSVFIALPLLVMAEAAFPSQSEFVSVEAVEISASPDEVWASITNMGVIEEPPGAPFGWGLAYPVAGEIDGEGVGAVRKGVFSTGIAYERVTVWKPGEELTFDVLSDPPALKELSPYDEVMAPHLAGYFSTAYAKFTIEPLPGGKSRLSLETLHRLQLEPAIYWSPIAQWAVHENKLRVLRHFGKRAETGAVHP